MRGCPCIILVPLADNDGREFAPEVIVDIKRAIDRQFGGYTVLGLVEGSWQGQVEPLLRIQVVVEERRIEEFKTLVKAIGRRLGQKAMYFDAPAPSAEIIMIEDGEGE